MTDRCLAHVGLLASILLGTNAAPSAQTTESPIPLVIQAGRPLRVALDRSVRVKRVGQHVTATLLEPVYSYDRIVLPAGTKVAGHIGKLEPPPKRVRAGAMVRGDFAPPRHVMLQFDSLVLSDGRTLPIRTIAIDGAEQVTLRVAGTSKKDGPAARAREKIAREAKRGVAVVTAPGKLERLKNLVLRALPYRPQFVPKGTVYSARLEEPLALGSVTPIERAPAGTAPAPESILNARLLTPLNSLTSASGQRVEAVLTAPVFSTDQRVILPEGTTFTGQVTLAKKAGRFHRNGQLRFLFESVRAPATNAEKLLASLYSVESRQQDRLIIDDEGGAAITNSKTRFAAPVFAALAIVGSVQGRVETDTDGAGPEMAYGDPASSAVGGFIGLSALGIGLSQISRPITVAIAALGLARTGYTSVFGKGREVSFRVDTIIQLQLAPGPAPKAP